MSNRVHRSVPLYSLICFLPMRLSWPTLFSTGFTPMFICCTHLRLLFFKLTWSYLKNYFPAVNQEVSKVEIPLFHKVNSVLAQQFMVYHLWRSKLVVVTHLSLEGRKHKKERQQDAIEESWRAFKPFIGIHAITALPHSKMDPVFSHGLWIFAVAGQAEWIVSRILRS